MDIRLDPSRHCIETEIKKQYNQAIAAYFKAGMAEKRRLEATIEVFHSALETMNFSHLRTHHPPLAGGTDRNIILSRENEDLTLTIDGRKLKGWR
jgi:hypothetical protein